MRLDLDIEKRLVAGARRFDLRVRCRVAGERIVLLGPSGAGKSLTLKAIAGLLRPDRGHIRLDGRSLFDAAAGVDLPPQRRRVAYLFQDYALFPHLSVRQNIAFGLKSGWFNPGRDHASAAVDYWLDAFGLAPLAGQLPEDLSGGQRQRTALARALVAEPSALLLDEPFAALDPDLRVVLRHELDELQRRLAVPMLLITHDPADAAVFGDHILRLCDGAVDAGNSAENAAGRPPGEPARS